MRPVVDVVWDHGYDAAALLREVVLRRTGTDPGPLHHRCQRCGSITHGQPSFDAPVQVSLARAGDLVAVAVGADGPLGIDIEVTSPTAAAWTRHEALAKAHGTGIVVDHAPDGPDAWFADLVLPAGYVGTLAVLTEGVSRQPEVRAAPRHTARS